uniref:Putative diguanylate cyclase with PAS sensor n=1 Tax=Magnetococcus massalia (strain MO-1) TaxID=451514 RepID=A0A1S7LHL6_MAGMO|nr:putative diguanylate cyclase with PAS sensor [Candidatus Magnetococcus massalia]
MIDQIDTRQYAGEAFSSLTLFRDISWEEVAPILQRCAMSSLQPGEVLLDPVHPNERLYMILDGCLTIHLKSKDTPAITSLWRGNFVGELSLIDQKYPTAYVVVEEEALLLAITRDILEQLVEESSTFVFNLLQVFSNRMRFSTDALIESHFVRTVPDIIYRLDAQGRFVYLNESVEKLGFEPEELLGEHFSRLINASEVESVSFSQAVVRQRAGESLEEGSQPKLFDERRTGERRTQGLELQMLKKVGRGALDSHEEAIFAEVSCTGIQVDSLKGGEKVYHGTIGIIRDVTERHLFLSQLSEQKAKIEAIFNTMADALLVTDSQGVIESVNHSACEIFGYSERELLGLSVDTLLPNGSDSTDSEKLGGHWRHMAGQRQEVHAKRKSGRHFEAELSVSRVGLESRVLYTGIIRDITERKEAERRITYQANYDALTGIPNRNHFQTLLGEAIVRAEEKQRQVGLIFIDLDRFKWVNDTLGHGAGDTLLQSSSKRVASCLKSRDIVARLGGDEFVAILEDVGSPEQSRESIRAVAKRVLESLNKPFTLHGQEVYISGSLGVALYPDDAPDKDQLLKRADEAMYAAKHAGRNACHFVVGEPFNLPKNYDVATAKR